MTGIEPLLILGALALLSKSKGMTQPADNAAAVMQAAIDKGNTVTFAKLLAAQAIHESANFTSNVFKKNNNAFGMKTPRVRKSPYILGAGSAAPASEGPTPYAKYASVSDSAKDVLHWLAYNKVNTGLYTTPDAYAAVLKSKGYYGDTVANYTRALKAALKKLDQ